MPKWSYTLWSRCFEENLLTVISFYIKINAEAVLNKKPSSTSCFIKPKTRNLIRNSEVKQIKAYISGATMSTNIKQQYADKTEYKLTIYRWTYSDSWIHQTWSNIKQGRAMRACIPGRNAKGRPLLILSEEIIFVNWVIQIWMQDTFFYLVQVAPRLPDRRDHIILWINSQATPIICSKTTVNNFLQTKKIKL